MNFIFISPNFPTNYWQFCKELKITARMSLALGIRLMMSWILMLRKILMNITGWIVLKIMTRFTGPWHFFLLNMERLTGWKAIMNIGLKRTPCFGPILILRQALK